MDGAGLHKAIIKAAVIALFMLLPLLGKAGFLVPSDSLSINQKVKHVLTKTANPDIILLADEFDRIWSSPQLLPAHKQLLDSILQHFEKQNFRARPYYVSLIEGLSGAIEDHQLPKEDIDLYLKFIDDYIAREEPEKLRRYLIQTAHLFKRSALYYTNYYKLVFQNGSLELDEEAITYVAENIDFVESTEEEDVWAGYDWGDTNTDDDAWGDTDAWSDTGWDNETDDGWGNKMESDDFFAEEEDERSGGISFFDPAPTLIGPLAKLKNVDLIFITPFDSFYVRNTSASIELPGLHLVAQGGIMDWTKVGFSPDSVFAILDKFHFQVNKPVFEAEGVKMTHKGLFEGEVEGLVEYKTQRKGKNGHVYPKFFSVRSQVVYSSLKSKNIDLIGGFTMEGKKVSTAAILGKGSVMKITNETGPVINARARVFDFEDQDITSTSALTSIYHRRDSIFHPGLKVRYNTDKKEIALIKSDGTFDKTPFFSSYFNIYFSADIINWDTSKDSILISTMNARSHNPAVFESAEYYNEFSFNSLSGLGTFHPLILVANHSQKINNRTFYLAEMLDNLPKQISANSVRGSMMLLMQNGFIEYEHITGRIKVLNRTFHYVQSQRGKKDYDNMKIESVIGKGPNAILNLSDQELTINGVKEFNLNIKLGVSILPKDEKVVLKKNRDLMFDGVVKAGNYEYIGEEFTMDYDSFLIDMPKIERIKFNLEQQNKKKSGAERVTLENSLVETAGVLYINKPDNKSALKDYPNYPVFNATQGATVYFLGEEILGGVYDQSLYFVIPPFEIDSVSSSDPASISFEGTFHSGGVFPPFEERLRVMPDNSLGFDHPLPDEGMEIYDGIARVFGKLMLNNKGMQGSDRIEYLSTTLYAPSFVFFKDSVIADGSIANIAVGDFEGTSFPDVEMENYKLRWLPAKDSMYISSKRAPFSMYDNTAEMKGTLIVNRKALFGMGELITRGSVTKTRRFRFREYDIAARQANFIIESSEKDKPALRGNGVRLSFDLNKGQAGISPERQGRAAIDFPFANYKTSIPAATWDLENKNVVMRKPKEVPIKNSYFYSTRKDQDSLAFNASEAVYDIDKLELKVSGIPYIISADAKIIPENNEALILANAEIQDFYNAKLILDTLHEYHRLFDGNIKILSRSKFEGNATYRFSNGIGDTFNIVMGNFELVATEAIGRAGKIKYRTQSVGVVDAMDNLLISPGMYFKGTATMYADLKALELDGFVKLDLKSNFDYDIWIEYKSGGDRQEIIFDFDNSITEFGEKLTAGLHFETGINDMYATFVTDKRSPTDEDFFVPSGLLYYNKEANEYVIEDDKKGKGESYSGKLFAYNETTSDVRFEGPMQFIPQQDKDFAFNAAGSGFGNIQRSEFNFNTLMIFKLSLPKQSIQMMGQDALEVIERLGAPEANKDFSKLLFKVAEIIGHEAVKTYEERSFEQYTPLYMAGRGLLEDLVLSNVDLKWSEGSSSWYSTGKIGLSHFGAFDVNASIDGFFEIRKRLEGEVVTIFLQVSPSCWFYFKYENNELLFYSANEDINKVVQSKSKAGKAKVGQYIFQTSDIQDVRDFIREFRRTYYNIDAPYFLEMAGSESYQAPAAPIQTQTQQADDDDDDGF